MQEEYIQHSMFDVDGEATPQTRPKKRRIQRVPEDAHRRTYDFSHLDFSKPPLREALGRAYGVLLSRRRLENMQK